MSYHLKILGKIQRRAAIWILEAFKTSPTLSIEAITGLILIKLHLQKLSRRSQLRVHSLLPNHLIQSLIDSSNSESSSQHPSSLNFLTSHQRSLIKSHVVDMDNRINGIFPSFSPLHFKLSPGYRVIDNFSDHIVFNLHSKQKEDKTCAHQLDNMVIESFSSLLTAIVVTDANIKNNTAISISHTHTHNHPIAKTVHHAVHIMSSKAELFTIRYGINQALNQDSISKIIVVTDSIYVAKKIFDPSSHPLQIHSVIILAKLHQFFLWHLNNFIKF